MTGLNWSKAKRDSNRARAYAQRQGDQPHESNKRRSDRQLAMIGFVDKHDLVCFVCHHDDNEWARTGISKRGPWAICVPCIEARH